MLFEAVLLEPGFDLTSIGNASQIVSGDTVVVKVDRPGTTIGEERKLSLSSLRAPRQVHAPFTRAGSIKLAH